MSFLKGFSKTAAQVCMSHDDFVKEHTKLVRELKHPKKKELQREAKEQGEELKHELRKGV